MLWLSCLRCRGIAPLQPVQLGHRASCVHMWLEGEPKLPEVGLAQLGVCAEVSSSEHLTVPAERRILNPTS